MTEATVASLRWHVTEITPDAMYRAIAQSGRWII
jgi:hypothetical protein